MGDLLFAPHHDDETLFAAYTVLKYKPTVITICSDAQYQTRFGISRETRRAETARALWWLGDPQWVELGISDVDPDWNKARDLIKALAAENNDVPRVFCPLWEEGGHEHHNRVSQLVHEIFWDVRFYSTYVRGSGRSQVGQRVEHGPTDPAAKFRAMSCYDSQINLDNTRPWFNDWDKEWMT